MVVLRGGASDARALRVLSPRRIALLGMGLIWLLVFILCFEFSVEARICIGYGTQDGLVEGGRTIALNNTSRLLAATTLSPLRALSIGTYSPVQAQWRAKVDDSDAGCPGKF